MENIWSKTVFLLIATESPPSPKKEYKKHACQKCDILALQICFFSAFPDLFYILLYCVSRTYSFLILTYSPTNNILNTK